MMHGQIQPVMIPGELAQPRPKQRTPTQVVGDPGNLGGQTDGLLFGLLQGQPAQIEDREIETRWRLKHWDGLAADDVEGGPPRLVPADDLVEGPAEARRIERPVLADGD